MKRFTTSLMVAAAALMAVAGSASAQVLKAQIPFYFSAGNAGMSPGTYRVEVQWRSGVPTVAVSSLDGNQKAMMISSGAHNTPRDLQKSGQPALSFTCNGARCELSAISMGYGGSTVGVPVSKAVNSDRADLRIVNATAAKAD
jgi:hypothetical protein